MHERKGKSNHQGCLGLQSERGTVGALRRVKVKKEIRGDVKWGQWI